MQNKGFVRILAASLTLVCLFYLSFTVVTSTYSKKAAEYGNGSFEKESLYLDSVSNEKVWLGYTLKECREKEVNLGLDLKGGMNVIMELSVGDVLRSLATNRHDEKFNSAIKAANERSGKGEKNYINLFVQEYKKIDPTANLASLFTSVELKDRINFNSTDSEVIAVLEDELKGAIDNSFNVLRQRIDRFGVVAPNIQRMEQAGRISIELPGVKEPLRVQKLLQGNANLQFWETYKMSEIAQSIIEANNVIININKEKQEGTTPALTDTTTVKTEATEAPQSDLLAKIEETAAKDTTQKAPTTIGLFSYLEPAIYNNQPGNGPVIGHASYRDTARINRYFEERQVKEILPRDLVLRWTVNSVDNSDQIYQLIALKASTRTGDPVLTGDVITDAVADFGRDQSASSSIVSMSMNSEGAKTWARVTRESTGRCIAIVLDNYVYSYPTVNGEIAGGRSEISGNFTPEEAKDLANVLKSGKMAATVKIISSDIVGPSLGKEAIESGAISFVIALVLLMIYMICFYGLIPGLIANLGLILNLFFTMGVLSSFQAVLTLSGIAGLVLSLGVAVDANVLIYERTKEELRNGSNLKKAIIDGYKNAFSAIFDSNLTSIITAIILFYFGTGPIKGFATTLIIGLVISFFTSVFITRLIFETGLAKGKFLNLTFATSLTKKFLIGKHIDFIGLRKKGYVISGIVILIMIGSFFTRDMNYGIDFTGGRNFIAQFEKPVSTEEIQSSLKPLFGNASLNVITIGTDNKVRITTNYKIENEEAGVDDEIMNKLYEGLKPFLKEGQKFEEFASSEGTIKYSQKVGPAIAKDITTGAIWAVIFSMIGMAFYILIRFRNISFSIGTLGAVLHDTLFIIGTYSLLYNILPFSMEVDQSFIAAILTVIGYSVNDTVVVFDRIREIMENYPKRNLKELINEAVNSTLSRTINTSLSTLVVLLSIFILGGDTIRSFIFAMIVGIFVGTYSTLFISVPLAYEIKKKQNAKKELKKA